MALPERRRLSSAALRTLVRTKPVAYDDVLSLRAVRDLPRGFRCAVIVPAAIAANPAERNRVKRAITEAVRLVTDDHEPGDGWRCIVMARTATVPDAGELRARVLELLKKSDIVSQ